jgi:enoyl-CoA hydratase/carnithine racemase
MSDRYAAYTKLKIDYPSKRILRLTFDRPETYNSVDAETHTQLTHIWRDINDDPDINAVVVTGAGKAFSAGGDFERSIYSRQSWRAWRPGRRPRTSSTTSSIATSRSSRPSTAWR